MTLPGFEPDPEPEVRPRSAKDEDDAQKVGYRRYNGAPMLCTVCVRGHDAGMKGIRNAAYLRIGPGDVKMPLCMMHKQDQLHRDQLDGTVPL